MAHPMKAKMENFICAFAPFCQEKSITPELGAALAEKDKRLKGIKDVWAWLENKPELLWPEPSAINMDRIYQAIKMVCVKEDN